MDPVFRSPAEVLEDLRAAVAARSSGALGDLSFELHVALTGLPTLPDELFGALADLLGRAETSRLPETWQLLTMLNRTWEQLTQPSRDALRSILLASLSRENDWMWDFVALEQLGDRFPVQDTLDSLLRGLADRSIRSRALVPNALDHLARKADSRVAQRARAALERLRSDPDEEVRQEAELSLRRLARATGGAT